MTQPLISLCMIVKDEEEFLDKCLTNVKDLVDEIIVVDTGSTDNTVEIAKNYSATVINYEWNHDFAAARNVGLDAATGKWILWLDADELIETGIHPTLREEAEKNEHGVFVFNVVHYLDGTYKNIQYSTSTRMFPNKPNYRYRRKIHEHFLDSILEEKPDTTFFSTPFKIFHYGYMKENIDKRHKSNRNISSLLAAIEEDPHDTLYHYYLGLEYMSLFDFQNAYNALHKARTECKEDITILPIIYKNEACCLFEIGKGEESAQLLVEGATRYPTYTDLFHVLGMIYTKLQQYDEARTAYLKAIELGVPKEYETLSGIGTYKTYYLLGKLEEEVKHYDDALRYYQQAVEEFGDSPILVSAVERVKSNIQEK